MLSFASDKSSSKKSGSSETGKGGDGSEGSDNGTRGGSSSRPSSDLHANRLRRVEELARFFLDRRTDGLNRSADLLEAGGLIQTMDGGSMSIADMASGTDTPPFDNS